MRQVMIEVPKFDGDSAEMMTQGARQTQSCPLKGLMLKGLHVIDLPCREACRKFPPPILEDSSRGQPTHPIGQTLVPGSLSLPVAGDDEAIGIPSMLEEKSGQRKGVVRLHVDAALVLEGTLQGFGKQNAPGSVDQRDGGIVIGGTKPKVDCRTQGGIALSHRFGGSAS